MKKFLLIFWLLGMANTLLAQDYSHRKELYPSRYSKIIQKPNYRKIDSLQALVKNSPDDSIKVDRLNLIGNCFRQQNDTTFSYGIKAENIAVRINYPRGAFWAREVQANYYGTDGTRQLSKALAILSQSAALAEKYGWSYEIHRAYSAILNLYFYSADFPAAMRVSTKGLALAEKTNDTEKVAEYKNLLGFIYLRQGNPAESRKYYRQYLENAQTTRDSTKIMDAHIGLGEVLLAEGKPEQAIINLTVPMNFFRRYPNRGPGSSKTEKMPYSTFAVAKAYRDVGRYEEALRFCLTGFSYSDSIPYNAYDLANYYLITGSVYEKLNRNKQAIEVYRLGLNLSLQIKHAEDVRDAYESLSRIFSQMNRFDSAFHYEKLFSTMKDSIVNVRTRSEIQRINAEYDLSKKDQEIEQQRELHASEIGRQTLISNALILGAIFIAIISWLLYNRYRLKEKHEFERQLTGQRAELFGNFINSQNTERSRLARDIHDHVGTILSAAKLKLSGLEETSREPERNELMSSLAMLDQAAESLRNISHNLMPASLSRLGLVVALEHFFNQLAQVSAPKITFSAYHFNERLHETMETNLYPIVLELANNAMRHAHAKNLNIQIIRHPDRINITVEDDGGGFDYESKRKGSKGLGLSGIESRIEILKGVLNLDSVVGRGTVVMIDVPV